MCKKIIIIFCSLLALVACGFKGPLYLPKDQPAPSNPGNNQFAPKPNQIESNIIMDNKPESIIIESK